MTCLHYRRVIYRDLNEQFNNPQETSIDEVGNLLYHFSSLSQHCFLFVHRDTEFHNTSEFTMQ